MPTRMEKWATCSQVRAAGGCSGKPDARGWPALHAALHGLRCMPALHAAPACRGAAHGLSRRLQAAPAAVCDRACARPEQHGGACYAHRHSPRWSWAGHPHTLSSLVFSACACLAVMPKPASSPTPAELGDLESAGKYYDLCISAIQSEAQQPLSSTWDV